MGGEAEVAAVEVTRTGAARDRYLGLAMVILASVSYGVQGVLAKYAYDGHADVSTLLAIRFSVATLMVWGLLPVISRGQRLPLRQTRRDLLGFALLGALFVTNSWFYYKSLTMLPAGTAAVLVFVFPALVVLWGRLFFREILTRYKVAALCLSMLGVVLTVDPATALAVGAAFSWAGVLWALGSAFSNSWYITLAAIIGRGKPAFILSLYSVPVTALAFDAYLALSGGFAPGINAQGWLSCMSIALLTGVSIYLYFLGIELIGASRAAIVATSEPATAVLLGALLLSEAVTPVKLLGGLCIAGAIGLLSLPARSPARHHLSRE